ncbi:MAG: methyl-accepting chemotaxis protein [Roseibium sp.]
MWNKLTIRAKIPLAIVGFAIAVGAGVGTASYLSAANETHQLTEDRLLSIAQSRRTEINDYLQTIVEDLEIVAHLPYTAQAVREFKASWSEIDDDQTAVLKKTYIADNPNPLGEKHKLDKGPADTGYDAIHGKFHPWYRELLERRGYYDIFLFDLEGDLIYSVFKEEDYATNFKTGGGKWADTDLGNAFRAAVTNAKDSVSFFDFKPYAPSNDAPASFMSTPIFEGSERVGVLVYQMPIDNINAIMAHKEGLGKTGETVIVGGDNLFRNDSRFTDSNDILTTKLDGEAITAALGGKEAFGISTKYRDLNLIEVAVPLEFHGVNWAILSLQSEAEAAAPLAHLRNWMLLAAGLLFALAAIGGYFIALSFTKPISRVVSDMEQVASGNTDIEVNGTERSDEIGDMNRAVQVFLDNAKSRHELESHAEIRRENERARQKEMERLVINFQESVSTIQASLIDRTHSMSDTAASMASVSENAASAAGVALSASGDATRNVRDAASAAEELSASIQEISSHTNNALKITSDAASAAEATDADVTALAGAAEKIGEVIEIIRAIAEQTNLLALNATIEAARAGEAGKGFAVVAAEVKELSTQTAKATDEIATQVAGVQASTQNAVEAIQAIGTQMQDVQEVTSAIAAAVEEQGAATHEISTSITRAATGSGNASENVEGVADAISQAKESSTKVETTANELSDVSQQLSAVVNEFLEGVSRNSGQEAA